MKTSTKSQREMWRVKIESDADQARRESGRKARDNGATAEKLFDQYMAAFAVSSLANCGPSYVHTNAGLIRVIQRGAVDRVGVVDGIPCAFEIKSAAGRPWNPSEIPEHELRFLREFSAAGGFAAIVIYATDENGMGGNWTMRQVFSDGPMEDPVEISWEKIMPEIRKAHETARCCECGREITREEKNTWRGYCRACGGRHYE